MTTYPNELTIAFGPTLVTEQTGVAEVVMGLNWIIYIKVNQGQHCKNVKSNIMYIITI